MDRLAAGQQKKGTEDGGEGKRGGGEDGRRIAVVGKISGDRRTNQETKSERHTDKGEGAGTLLGLGHVTDVSLGDAEVTGGRAVDGASEKKHPDVRGECEQQEAGEGSGLADEQQRAAAHAIGELAEDGSRDQLADSINRDELTDRGRRCAEALGIERQQRQNDGEAENVDHDDEEDGQERRSESAGGLGLDSA